MNLNETKRRNGEGETGIERPRSGSRPIYESDSHRTRSSRATRLFETTAGSANIMTSFRVSSAEEWRSLLHPYSCARNLIVVVVVVDRPVRVARTSHRVMILVRSWVLTR